MAPTVTQRKVGSPETPATRPSFKKTWRCWMPYAIKRCPPFLFASGVTLLLCGCSRSKTAEICFVNITLEHPEARQYPVAHASSNLECSEEEPCAISLAGSIVLANQDLSGCAALSKTVVLRGSRVPSDEVQLLTINGQLTLVVGRHYASP